MTATTKTQMREVDVNPNDDNYLQDNENYPIKWEVTEGK